MLTAGVHVAGQPPLAASRQARVFALRNATLVTVTKGTVQNGTVVVRDGKIVEAGANVNVPAGAEVVDVSGRYITPGIIDCHSHIATDGGVNEGSQSISCEVRIGDFARELGLEAHGGERPRVAVAVIL